MNNNLKRYFRHLRKAIKSFYKDVEFFLKNLDNIVMSQVLVSKVIKYFKCFRTILVSLYKTFKDILKKSKEEHTQQLYIRVKDYYRLCKTIVVKIYTEVSDTQYRFMMYTNTSENSCDIAKYLNHCKRAISVFYRKFKIILDTLKIIPNI